MRRLSRPVLAIGLVLMSGAPLWAQLPTRSSAEAVQGHVIDPDALMPVPSADVYLMSADERVAATSTDGAGFFWLEVPGPGTYAIEVRRIGYTGSRSAPFEIETGELLTVRFSLQPDAIALEPLIVTARGRSGMYDFLSNMEEWGRGIFLTPAAIDSIAPKHWADVFRGQEGIRLTWGWGVIDPDPTFPVMGAVPRVRTYQGRGCLNYVVDRTRIGADNRYLLNGLNRSNIVAVEIYRSVWEVPPKLLRDSGTDLERVWTNEFSGTSFKEIDTYLCGVVVYRTKRGW